MTFYQDIIRNDVILLLKMDPTLIMLNGRWKSDAILRYIRTDIISPEIITLALQDKTHINTIKLIWTINKNKKIYHHSFSKLSVAKIPIYFWIASLT